MNSGYETAEAFERKVHLYMHLYDGDDSAAKAAIRRGEHYGRKFSRSNDGSPITIDEFAIAVLLRMLIGDIETAAAFVRWSRDAVFATISARVIELPDDIRRDGERAWQRVCELVARRGDRA